MNEALVSHEHVYENILEGCIRNGSIVPKSEYSPTTKIVMAVSGAASLGKSTFCKGFEGYLRSIGFDAAHVQLDGYLIPRGERRKLRDPENPLQELSGNDPNATDLEKLVNDMERLLFFGQTIDLPLYNHTDGTISGSIQVSPAQITLLDGTIAFHESIRERFPNFLIFMYSDEATMKALGIEVDTKERGYTVDEARRNSETEFIAYMRHIHPRMKFADLRLFVHRDRKISIDAP